jgi:hypothetical protein
VSHETLLDLPSRLQHVLVVAPGGTHADGVTTNKLILFQDGFYIELIAFVNGIDDDLRKKHRWGHEEENTIIDWAYTLPHEDGFAAVRHRVQKADTIFNYTEPIPGGRTREDGVVLKWAVAVARNGDEALQPGIVPFWCLDRTARKLRVPYEENLAQTRHPCGARGISTLSVTAPEDQVNEISAVYDAIHAPLSARAWNFGVPSGSTTAKHSVSLLASSKHAIKISLWASSDSPRSVELLPGVTFELER